MATPENARLESISEKIRSNFMAKHQAREKALRLSREVIRYSANSIRATHRLEYPQARELVDLARRSIREAEDALKEHPEILYAGFVQDAQKEYAEASITLALVSGDPLPDPDDLGVGYAPYLNGVGEAVGEMRRFLLDALRRDRVSLGEELLGIMDDIYSTLVTMDFPDALTGGLRRTTDAVRGILERTRGDYTTAVRQQALERKLEGFQGKLGS